MVPTRWAILGPGRIATSFAEALPAAADSVLHAVGSSDPTRATAFAARYGAPVAGTYEEVLGRDDVDAVYIATVHTSHADLAVAALAAGKAVLVEKPAATNPADTDRVLEAARAAGRPLAEGYKNRFTPFHRELVSTVAAGRLGPDLMVEAGFGFAAPDLTGRLFDPDLAGGAILDVGCYPVSLVVALADAAGEDLTDLTVLRAEGELTDRGVDTSTLARLRIGSLVAQVHTSIVENLTRSIAVSGELGSLTATNGRGSGAVSADGFVLQGRDGVEEVEVPTVSPFAAEADAVARALREERTEVPEMPWSHTTATADLLHRWRHALDRQVQGPGPSRTPGRKESSIGVSAG